MQAPNLREKLNSALAQELGALKYNEILLVVEQAAITERLLTLETENANLREALDARTEELRLSQGQLRALLEKSGVRVAPAPRLARKAVKKNGKDSD